MRKTEIVVAVALVVASVFTGGVVEAKRGPSSVSVCVDSATGVVSRVSSSTKCVNGIQKWSASKLAPELCWNASSVDPKSQTRLVSIRPLSGCVAPLRSVPVGKLVLLCADQISGVLRWSVTNACEVGNANTWVRVDALRNAAAASATTTTTSVALVPSVSLQATVIQGNTWPKAVTVSANVAGTIYFVEGSVSVKSVKDITNSHPLLWAQGAVTTANTPTSIALDVENLVNGYYRVFVVTAQGALSSPASNIVTISVHPASQATTTTVAVRTQTLDQNYSSWSTACCSWSVKSSRTIGQSFTAGLSGLLSRVSLGITRLRTVTQITASIYSADGTGNAMGVALASETIVGTTVPTTNSGSLVNFDFASPISVTAGTKYVIVVTTPDDANGEYQWRDNDIDGYLGGNGILDALTTKTSVGDLYFQTYVDI